jgi:uncharacterized membrane protein
VSSTASASQPSFTPRSGAEAALSTWEACRAPQPAMLSASTTPGGALAYSVVNGARATEWNDGSVIDLGGLSGSGFSFATSINDAGQVVDLAWGSMGSKPPNGTAVVSSPWEACRAHRKARPSGSTTRAGSRIQLWWRRRYYAVEWSGGKVINLGSLSNSEALSINDAGQGGGIQRHFRNRVERWQRHQSGDPAIFPRKRGPRY